MAPKNVETEIVNDAYAALNRGDVDGFVASFDPQIVRIEFEGTPMGGTFHGIDAVKAHVSAGRSTWAEGACEPARLIVAEDKIVVITNIHVRLNGREDWLEGSTGDVFTFCNGKVTEFRTFADESDALRYAGLPVEP